MTCDYHWRDGWADHWCYRTGEHDEHACQCDATKETRWTTDPAVTAWHLAIDGAYVPRDVHECVVRCLLDAARIILRQVDL